MQIHEPFAIRIPPHRDPLATLNAAQRQAVMHGDSPLLVIAGAGTGKTRTLAHRVARLIADGVDPDSILLLSFSRRAASEMKQRVAHILAGPQTSRAVSARLAPDWAGTFHAVGARLLREHAGQIGLAQAFTIHDREDSADLMNLARHECGLSIKDKRFPTKQTCLAIYSCAVNTGMPLEAVLAKSFPWCAEWGDALRSLFAAYVEAKQAQAVLDYDDLLLYWAQMLQVPQIAARLGARFRHVLVDEYQDTNRLQADILHRLKPDGRGVAVFGDDAQSIYAFRGATVRNILDFPQQFDPPARIVTLEQNYRSTRGILDASNAVIAEAAERYDKRLHTSRIAGGKPQLVTVRDETAQARYVVEQVLALREEGLRLTQQAVLFRAADHSVALEVELVRRNIPFVKYGGLKFLEAAHVKDLLAILRWMENPRDRVAGFRVLLLLPGVGPKTAGRLLASMVTSDDPLAELDAFDPPAAAREDWLLLAAMLHATRAADTAWPTQFGRALEWYAPQLERRFEESEARLADLMQLERIAGTFASRAHFLTELALDPPDASSDESGVPLKDEDYLILSTIHSAKGQEWAAVFLLNAVDGAIPSDLATGDADEIEEERRLLYVAMTRAKDRLQILTPQRFYTHGQPALGDAHVYANCTRFLPAKTMPLFEARAWPAIAPPALNTPATPPPQALIDLAARMRQMWK